jgi:hypothetical protein
MYVLSAADAIAPAWQRTREVLFAPRSFRTFLKLSAVAALAELSNGFNLRFNSTHLPHGLSGAAAAIMTAVLSALLLFAAIGFIIALIIFYCGSRMQLVMVDVVAARQTVIAPLWAKYGRSVWGWIGLKVLTFVLFIAGMAVLLLPVALYIGFHVGFHHQSSHGIGAFAGGVSGKLLLIVIGLVLAFLLVIVLFIAAIYLLNDLVVPSIALENVTAREAVRRVFALCRHEPGQLTLYLLLRIVLGIALGIGSLVAILLAMFLAALPLGAVGVPLFLALHKGGGGAIVGLVVAAIVGGVLFLAWMLLVYVCVMGFVGTFFRSYALYFLGGRYPLLGNLLDSTTWPPPYAYAASAPAPTFVTPAATPTAPLQFETAQYTTPAETPATPTHDALPPDEPEV